MAHKNLVHKLSPARRAAYDVVRAVRERNAFAQDIIASRIDNSSLCHEDRAFATRLALGVVSMQGTLDELIDRCLRQSSDVQPLLRDALRISTYEIIFLKKSSYAAVDQGVELARVVAPKAAGLANYVLRKMVAFQKDFPFGDPTTDFKAFTRLCAFPEWLATLLVRDLGLQAAQAFMIASNEPPPLYIALNAASSFGEDVLLAALENAGGSPEAIKVHAQGIAIEGCYRLTDGHVLLDKRVRSFIKQGGLLVSDAASQAIAQCVLPAVKPRSFLEIGAGRGTKTILLQSNAVRCYGAQIDHYVTLDNHAFKTGLLTDRARDYGVKVDQALTADATHLDQVLPDRLFDTIFIDAPCSGLGTLRRHPEIRWRITPDRIKQCAQLGFALLQSAAGHVVCGGVLSYATCSVSRAENSDVITRFLQTEAGKDFRLQPLFGKDFFSTKLVPGGVDAHFLAQLVRVK